MTPEAILIMTIVSLTALGIGLALGYWIGVGRNWLARTVVGLNAELRVARLRIAALEHGEDDGWPAAVVPVKRGMDDWQERGIGR